MIDASLHDSHTWIANQTHESERASEKKREREKKTREIVLLENHLQIVG
jgi:hypothetical protein